MQSCRKVYVLLLICIKCNLGSTALYKDGCAIAKIGTLSSSNSFTIICDLESSIIAGVSIQTPGGTIKNCLIPIGGVSNGCPSQITQDVSSGILNWTVSVASTSEHNGRWTCTHSTTTLETVVNTIYMDTNPVFSPTNQSEIYVRDGDQNYTTFVYRTGCLYPKPSFTWIYMNSRNNATLLTVSESASHTEDLTTDCSAINANAKVFKSTFIVKYEETLAGETTKLKVSVTFQDDTQCFITELDKLSGEIVFLQEPCPNWCWAWVVGWLIGWIVGVIIVVTAEICRIRLQQERVDKTDKEIEDSVTTDQSLKDVLFAVICSTLFVSFTIGAIVISLIVAVLICMLLCLDDIKEGGIGIGLLISLGMVLISYAIFRIIGCFNEAALEYKWPCWKFCKEESDEESGEESDHRSNAVVPIANTDAINTLTCRPSSAARYQSNFSQSNTTENSQSEPTDNKVSPRPRRLHPIPSR